MTLMNIETKTARRVIRSPTQRPRSDGQPTKPLDREPTPTAEKVTSGRAAPPNPPRCNGVSSLQALFEAKSFKQHFQPNSTVLLHDDPADAIYLIESGTVRCCTIDSEGTRQIFSFATKGTFVGISDFDRWHFTAEAVDHVIVKSIQRSTLEQELAVNIHLRQEIRALLCVLLQQRERQLLSLMNAKAPDRLFQFLKEFAASRSTANYVALPMPRRDIADHLGMTAETVSRAFGDLKNKGLIDLGTHEKYKILSKTATQPKALPSYA